jgi:cell wall-associated NlpC family hydrolase
MNASHWIGVPYSELDCYALVCMAADDLFSIEYPDVFDYAQHPSKAIQDTLASDWRWRKIEAPTPGCVVLLGTNGSAKHVGLYLGDDAVLHAHRKAGSCIQSVHALGYLYSLEGYYVWSI